MPFVPSRWLACLPLPTQIRWEPFPRRSLIATNATKPPEDILPTTGDSLFTSCFYLSSSRTMRNVPETSEPQKGVFTMAELVAAGSTKLDTHHAAPTTQVATPPTERMDDSLRGEWRRFRTSFNHTPSVLSPRSEVEMSPNGCPL